MNPLFLFGTQSTPLRKLLLMKIASGGGKLVEYTVTGNPVTFETDIAKPLRSVLATWQPHQSGSGDPSPSNVRPVVGMDGVNVWQTGENLLNPVWWDDVAENKSYVRYEDGTLVYQSNTYKTSDYVSVMGNTEYTLHAVMNGQQSGGIAFYDSSKQYISGTKINNGTKTDHTFTTPSNAVYMRFWDNNDKMPWNEVMLVYGSTAPTAYSPYSGTSYSVAFPVLGKNLFDGQYINGVVTGNSSQGYSLNTVTNAKSAVIKCEGNTTYTIKKYSQSNRFSIALSETLPENGTSLQLVIENQALTEYTFTTLASSAYIVVYVSTGSEQAEPQMMVNVGSSALPYEPYTTTVYGGSLDLTTGVLTATHIAFDKKWSEYTFISTTDGYTAKKLETKADIYNTSQAASRSMCNIMAYSWNGSSIKKPHYYINDDANTTVYAYLTDDVSEDTRILIVTQLKTPVIVATLSPTQITALLGNNTMWADADDLSVTYLKKG